MCFASLDFALDIEMLEKNMAALHIGTQTIQSVLTKVGTPHCIAPTTLA